MKNLVGQTLTIIMSLALVAGSANAGGTNKDNMKTARTIMADLKASADKKSFTDTEVTKAKQLVSRLKQMKQETPAGIPERDLYIKMMDAVIATSEKIVKAFEAKDAAAATAALAELKKGEKVGHDKFN